MPLQPEENFELGHYRKALGEYIHCRIGFCRDILNRYRLRSHRQLLPDAFSSQDARPHSY